MYICRYSHLLICEYYYTAIHNYKAHMCIWYSDIMSDISLLSILFAFPPHFYFHFHFVDIFFSYSTNNSIVLAIAISTDTYSPFICNITILYAVCSVNWVRDEQVRFIALQITLYVSSKIALKFFFYSSHLLFTFYVS